MDNSNIGFTKFPNDILESATKRKLTGTQLAVLLYIVRKTYGFNKGQFGDFISISKMAAETGYSRRAITAAVNYLEENRIVAVAHSERGRGRTNNFRVTDPREWRK